MLLRWALAAVLGVVLTGCGQPPVAEVYPQVTEYSGRIIEELRWVNPEPFSEDSLDTLTQTEETHCRWLSIFPFCFFGTDWGLRERTLDIATLGQDLARLDQLYRQSGYFGTRVVPEVAEPNGDDAPIHLSLVVHRGDGIVVDSVVVEGTEAIADPDSLARQLPLQDDELFDLEEFVLSADTVLETLRRRGHAYAEVLRNYAVDTLQDRATVWLVAVPGPRVVVDSVIVQGLAALDRPTALRHVVSEEGALLRRQQLNESQRNLYGLELVQFASVRIAPDSLQRTPEDSATATVLVQLTEAPEHVVETLAGYGTQDCARTTAQWTDRSFAGGARRLSITGSLSRFLCTAVDTTVPFRSEYDYRVAAELRQPYFLTARNNLVATAFAERQSEPMLFQREAQGARLALSHRIAERELLSASVDVERRQTVAAPALYCAAFAVCTPEDLADLGRTRWRNALSANWLRDAGNDVINPTSGYTLQTTLLWASPLLLSDYEFLRASAQGALYHQVSPGWVLAGYLRLGSFLTRATIGAEDFVGPEERFFAGGATSVRGYSRSRLGPGIWLYEGEQIPTNTEVDTLDVEFYPTGGTSVSVASIEARFPSPVLGDLTSFAAFIDAGAVGLDPLWEMNAQWRVTPGMGVRVQTPVGPIRIDVAYNPYSQTRAPLYVQDFDTGTLRRIDDGYQPADQTFLERLQFHIGIGQAF